VSKLAVSLIKAPLQNYTKCN